MRVVIWNDQQQAAQRIQNWFNAHGHMDCHMVIANSYREFCESLNVSFDTEDARKHFFKDNLIVSDLGLANNGNATANAKPFQELATKLLQDHCDYPIIVFSTMANNRAVVGSAIYDYVVRVCNGDVGGLDIYREVWKRWQARGQ